jgi:hypothetical protein
MNLGSVGNASSLPQVGSEAAIKKSPSPGGNAIRIVYGDESKMTVLTAHVNRMAGFYAAVKPMLNGAGDH